MALRCNLFSRQHFSCETPNMNVRMASPLGTLMDCLGAIHKRASVYPIPFVLLMFAKGRSIHETHSAHATPCSPGGKPGPPPKEAMGPPLHSVLGGDLSAVRAQCNYLGAWPY